MLPPEVVPFPVDGRSRVRPDLMRFGPGEAGHLRLDARWPAYAEAKLALLERSPERCRVLAADADRVALERALRRLAGVACGELPDWIATDGEAVELRHLGVRLAGDAVVASALPGGAPRWSEGRGPDVTRVLAHLAPLEPVARLADALALALQEDVVAMAAAPAAPGGGGRAELLHVCFPSHWDPAAHAGSGFGAFHGPVPDNAALLAAGPRVVDAMIRKGPFVRHVWSLTERPELDAHPSRPEPPRRDPARLWMRVERQTTLPLPDLERSLFTIRVYLVPLASAVAEPGRRETLASEVRSMSDGMLRYKGLVEVRERLLRWLEADPGPGAATPARSRSRP